MPSIYQLLTYILFLYSITHVLYTDIGYIRLLYQHESDVKRLLQKESCIYKEQKCQTDPPVQFLHSLKIKFVRSVFSLSPSLSLSLFLCFLCFSTYTLRNIRYKEGKGCNNENNLCNSQVPIFTPFITWECNGTTPSQLSTHNNQVYYELSSSRARWFCVST